MSRTDIHGLQKNKTKVQMEVKNTAALKTDVAPPSS